MASAESKYVLSYQSQRNQPESVCVGVEGAGLIITVSQGSGC